MSQIKLYKKFYQFSIIRTGNTVEQNYVLFEPFMLSANTYVAGTGDTESMTQIESSLQITEDSFGVYYADLNPFLYASDVTYDLVWYVNYTNTAPTKKLSTRFRINVNTVTNSIEIEFINTPLEFDISNPSNEIEVLGKY